MSEMFQLDKKHATAYVMINCEPGSEEHVLDEIRMLPEIKESTLTVGHHDILAKIEADSPEGLRDAIVQKIRRIPEIRCTTTLVCTMSGCQN